MTILIYIVLGLIIFIVAYRMIFARKDFKMISFLKDISGCNEAIAHQFVAYEMPRLIGNQGWSRFRDEVLVNTNAQEKYLFPIFIAWIRTRSENNTPAREADIDISNNILASRNLTFEDIEIALDNIRPILASYKI